MSGAHGGVSPRRSRLLKFSISDAKVWLRMRGKFLISERAWWVFGTPLLLATMGSTPMSTDRAGLNWAGIERYCAAVCTLAGTGVVCWRNALTCALEQNGPVRSPLLGQYFEGDERLAPMWPRARNILFATDNHSVERGLSRLLDSQTVGFATSMRKLDRAFL